MRVKKSPPEAAAARDACASVIGLRAPPAREGEDKGKENLTINRAAPGRFSFRLATKFAQNRCCRQNFTVPTC